ncbi:MAG: acylneuraminate cytidylyltransferase family protein [Proteobacteria bacterium]|nr:acylneuraminate cytidylyltransferase family protein [Pseudomonadota bacterium]
MSVDPSILVTICARKGSKGVPLKNIRPLHGLPLIAHTVRQALAWPRKLKVVVSTDAEEIAEIARHHGAETPFLRPAELATDTIAKMPVLIHALEASEKHYGMKFDVMLDLDPTSPVRTVEDIERGWNAFRRSGRAVCFSVVKARKNRLGHECLNLFLQQRFSVVPSWISLGGEPGILRDASGIGVRH